MKIKMIGLSIALLLFHGCSATDSDNIKTKGIYANYQLKLLNNNRTFITTALQSGGSTGTYLDLTSDDVLKVEVDKEEKTLKRDRTILNQIYYENTIETNTYNKEVKIIFIREESNEKLISSVTLPSKLTINSPQQNDTVSSTDRLGIDWDKPKDNNTRINIDILISCKKDRDTTVLISDNFNDLSDNGKYSINLSSILDEDFEQYRNCEGTIHIRRYKRGTIDSHFVGGIIEAFHSKSIMVNIK